MGGGRKGEIGGESGIRTHGRILSFNGFQDRRLQPAQPSLQDYFLIIL